MNIVYRNIENEKKRKYENQQITWHQCYKDKKNYCDLDNDDDGKKISKMAATYVKSLYVKIFLLNRNFFVWFFTFVIKKIKTIWLVRKGMDYGCNNEHKMYTNYWTRHNFFFITKLVYYQVADWCFVW